MATNSNQPQNQRPAYYEGQFLGAAALTAGVLHERLAAARHALGAHAWGIAAGLELVEQSLPSGAVNVSLMPGIAWDGYGRCVVVAAPTQLAVAAFANYQSATPASGTLVKVWLRYSETAGNQARQGYALCCDDSSGAVVEGWTLEVGDLAPGPSGTVAIAGNSVAPAYALRQFSTAEPLLHDASVPFQQFPYADGSAVWRIPIGLVRWYKAGSTATGRFLPRDDSGGAGGSAPLDSDQDRAFRQYLGVIGESLYAPAGAIRLRDRAADPSTSIYTPPSIGGKAHNDLVWLEGSTRVVGDLRVCGGILDFRDALGASADVPEILRRNVGNVFGGQSLELAFAPTPTGSGSAAGTNAFTVGTVAVDPASGTLGALTSLLTVRDNGYLALGGGGVQTKVEIGGPLILDVASGDKLGLPSKATLLWNDGSWVRINANLDQSPINTGVAISNALNCAGLNVGNVGASGGSTSPVPAPAGAAWIGTNLIVGTTPTLLGSATTLSSDTSGRSQGNVWIFSASGDFEYDGGNDGLFVFNNRGKVTTFNGPQFGINTTAPAATFDIAGSFNVAAGARIAGGLNASGISTISGALTATGLTQIDGVLIVAATTSFTTPVACDSDLHVDGSFTCPSKFFLVPHPLDAENMELLHGCLEGPEMGVFYRGEGQLGKGVAEVMLPDYFEALTRKDGRSVLLTPTFTGNEALSPLAAGPVVGGKFKVRGVTPDNPAQTFHWEVKAVRSDVPALDPQRTKPGRTAAAAPRTPPPSAALAPPPAPRSARRS
jgi:hypothetical protein